MNKYDFDNEDVRYRKCELCGDLGEESEIVDGLCDNCQEEILEELLED